MLQYCAKCEIAEYQLCKKGQCITIQSPSEVKCRRKRLPLRMMAESCDGSFIFIYACHDTRLYIIFQLLDFSSSNQNDLLISFGKGGNFVITLTVIYLHRILYLVKRYDMVHIKGICITNLVEIW